MVLMLWLTYKDGAAILVGNIAHFAQAFLLELHVAHGQDLVHYHDLAVQVGGYGERQLDEHAAGIPLDGGVDKIAALGKFNDLGSFASISARVMPKMAPFM